MGSLLVHFLRAVASEERAGLAAAEQRACCPTLSPHGWAVPAHRASAGGDVPPEPAAPQPSPETLTDKMHSQSTAKLNVPIAGCGISEKPPLEPRCIPG